MMKKSPTILVIAGDEGNANIGDQAMFIELVRRIHARFPECKIVTLSRHPDKTLPVEEVTRCYDGYEYFSERNWITKFVERYLPRGEMLVFGIKAFMLLVSARLARWGMPECLVSRAVGRSGIRILNLIKGSAVVLSCGGGYLNSVFRFGSLWPYCILYRTAAAIGRPVLLMGQGIGPIWYKMDRVVLRWGLKHVRRIALRDSGGSSDFLLRLGVRPGIIADVGDDAVDLPVCSDEELRKVCMNEGIPLNKTVVTAQFRPTSYTSQYSGEYTVFARVLDALIERLGCHVVFVPTCYHEACDDRCAAYAVFIRMRNRACTTIINGQYRPEVIKRLVGLGQIALGVSYHFGVFALTQGVPVFTFYANEYYRDKFQGLYGHFGNHDWSFCFETLVPEQVVERAAQVLEELEAIKTSLLEHTKAIQARVEAEYDLVASYIEKART